MSNRLHKVYCAEGMRVLPHAQHLETVIAERTELMALTEELLAVNEQLQMEMEAHRTLQAQLAKSEARYRAVVEDQTELICRFDSGMVLTFVNGAFSRFFDGKREALLGQSFLSFIPEQEREAVTAMLAALSVESPIGAVEHQAVDAYWDVRWLQWTSRAFFDYDRGLVEIQAVGRDITRQKMMEKEMAHFDRLSLIGQMAAGISHEIRNPMTTVRGFLQLLSAKKECQHFKGYFDLMIEELDRANSIISEFLALARNKKMDQQAHGLNSIIDNIYPLINADALLSEKTIILDLKKVPDLVVDANEIRQLILNLVRNALEAMDGPGKVTIKTYRHRRTVVLAVQDEGPGIPSQILSKLGTPFFTTKDKGTGLGLAMCYSIAARHRAEIDIDTSSKGTTFYVRFQVPSK